MEFLHHHQTKTQAKARSRTASELKVLALRSNKKEELEGILYRSSSDPQIPTKILCPPYCVSQPPEQLQLNL